jgi:SHS2 domain-containing protein
MVSPVRPRHWKFGTTADVGIGAVAHTPQELFSQLGVGLFSLMTDLRDVRTREEKSIVVNADTPQGLVVRFLNELLYLHETEGWVFREFSVRLEGSPPTTLMVKARGEPWDERRHERHMMVKAITLHRLEVDLKKGKAKVIVDI